MDDRTTIQVSEETRKKLKVLASKEDLSYDALLGKMMKTFRANESGQVVIKMPKQLNKKISSLIRDTGFKSVDEYVTYVMRQMVTASELHKEKTKAFTREDEKEVRERLRALGYI